METCANPGCTEPGTNKCSACKTTPYCGPICQTADWPCHKDACPGHLRKVGMAHLQKALAFECERNYVQALRSAELALTKLKQLKDRTLVIVKILDEVLRLKNISLSFLNRHKDALECATDRYNMWATTNMRNAGMLGAAFPLIESLIHNEEYSQAQLIARTAYEMIFYNTDDIIPTGQRQQFLARGSHHLAHATWRLSEAGGIPPEEKQKAGEEAIELARKAIEITSQLHGNDDNETAGSIGLLASALGHFNGVDDDEILRLNERTIAIYARHYGSTSLNVGTGENNLGNAYCRRSARAQLANNRNRELVNLQMALPHHREAYRIYRAVNYVDKAEKIMQTVVQIEQRIRRLTATSDREGWKVWSKLTTLWQNPMTVWFALPYCMKQWRDHGREKDKYLDSQYTKN